LARVEAHVEQPSVSAEARIHPRLRDDDKQRGYEFLLRLDRSSSWPLITHSRSNAEEYADHAPRLSFQDDSANHARCHRIELHEIAGRSCSGAAILGLCMNPLIATIAPNEHVGADS